MNIGTDDIAFLQHSSIDKKKWDDCLTASFNGRIYACSSILDALSPGWTALVLGNYEAVMPLTWKRKWGISYLHQPPFLQQGGAFSQKPLPVFLLQQILDQAMTHYRFAEINLNAGNEGLALPPRNNYILGLQRPYDEIASGYNRSLLNALSGSRRFPLLFQSSSDFRQVIDLYKNHYGHRTPHVKPEHYERLRIFCEVAATRSEAFIRTVSNADDKSLHALTLFLRDRHRIYNIMSVTLPEGRVSNANHFLMDQLIREFAGNDIILDFEGSQIPGIADFFQKFGSQNEPYFFYRKNNLPFPIRYFK